MSIGLNCAAHDAIVPTAVLFGIPLTH